MAPKSNVVSRSKQPSKPSKEKEVVRELSPEQEISEEEEDPEEEEEMFSENEIEKTTEPKSGSVPLNGFVSDSGSDYDSDDSNSGYKVQPITKLVTVSPAKRPISDSSNGGNLAKKAKTTTPSSKKSSNSGNNNNVSRIWHREDEIVLLKEMYEFKKAKGGVDLQLDMTAFFNSVKGKLDGEYSKEQFKSKIRHMRSKYLGIVKKGGDPGFVSSHEALVFDLSKKAWGDVDKGKKNVDNVVNEMVVVKGNGVVVGGKVVAKENAVVVGGKVVAKENGVVGGKVIAEVEEKSEKEKEGGEERFVCVPSYKFLKESVNVSLKYQQCLGLSDAAIKLMSENLGLIGAKNASQLDDEWKELFMEEVELNQKRASLVKKQVELVFSRIKKP